MTDETIKVGAQGNAKRLADMGDGTVAETVNGGGWMYAAVSGTVTRPNNTTAYASGQIIAGSTTAGSCVPITLAVSRAADLPGMIRRVRLKVNDTAWLNFGVRVHLFKDSPAYSNGDGANFAGGVTESNYLGACDVTLDKQFSDPFVKGFGAPLTGSEIYFEPSAGTVNIFAALEARSIVTPAALKVFTLVAEVLRAA